MLYLCHDCSSDDFTTYSEHYGCYLCMDCYNDRSQYEEECEMNDQDWQEFLEVK